jgi:FHS family L-fucose permease-like MFS transporter
MSTQKINIKKLLPVLMAFFVMSFVDMVGIAKDLVNEDLHLSEFILGFISFSTFVWFFILSVPVGILQSRIGKRLTLNIGMGITGLGLLIPFFLYNFSTVLLGFAFLGIGNTIVQVSANPLLVDVVPKGRASSFLSFSQFVKAIGSMIAPFLAAQFALHFGDWKILFLVFGIVSFLSVLWLGTVPIEETKQDEVKATFASCFKLLGDKFVLLMVLSIFLVVGIDVGFNFHSGSLLINQFGFKPEDAKLGRSIYFFGRMIGTFGGALLLTRISSRKFLMWTSGLGILVLAALLLAHSAAMAWILVFMTGLTVANIWPLVFSIAVEKYPERNNEISGLMMMAISGGAVIPLLIGWISDISSVTIGMSILILSMIYLFSVSLYSLKKQ